LIKSGRMYYISEVDKRERTFYEVQKAIDRKIKPGYNKLKLQRLWRVRWREKPFPWSYNYEFKPNIRYFFHGTTVEAINNILDEGFKIKKPAHGRMLGDGIYLTYHTHKAANYAKDEYLLSCMVYAPNTIVINPGEKISNNQIAEYIKKYDAIEVRTGSFINNYQMKNHEICVYDTRRVIPKFISLVR